MSVDGELSIIATDSAGIFANVKMVSSSATTNDGGAGVIQKEINNFVPADFSTSEGSRTINFGQRVRIAKDYIANDVTSEDVADLTQNSTKVLLSDDYGAVTFTSKSGNRLVTTGDNVEVEDGYDTAKGTAGSVYHYRGANGRLNLGTQDYTDTNLWAVVSGVAGATYEYLGADTSQVDLSTQDYSDTSKWKSLGGVDGSVYEYMGTTATLDLSSQDYTDLILWKPVPITDIIPTGINVTDSDSNAVGGIVVLNDVRSDVEAFIHNAKVTAASIDIESFEQAVIRAIADSTVSSSGGSSFTGEGDSLAVNAVIATNLILSQANAYASESDLKTTAGDLTVSAEDVSQIDATVLNSSSSAGKTAGVTLAFNSIGWKSQNFLFNAVDTLLGDPLIANAFGNQQPAQVFAYISNTPVDVAGKVEVSALNEAAINAEVSNESSAVAIAFDGATSLAVGFMIGSNLVNVKTKADIDHTPLATDMTPASTPTKLVAGDRVKVANGDVYEYQGSTVATPTLSDATQHYTTSVNWKKISSVKAGGTVTVYGEESATIDASGKVLALAVSKSDGGLSVVTNLLTAALTDYQYTTKSGVQNVKTGELVRLADDYVHGGTPGSVYRFKGPDSAGVGLNLGLVNFNDGNWAEVTVGNTFDDLNVSLPPTPSLIPPTPPSDWRHEQPSIPTGSARAS